MSTPSGAAPAARPTVVAAAKPAPQGDFGVMRRLLPYLWEYRGRVALAIALLVGAKLANITVPMVMKQIVDGLSGPAAMLEEKQ